MNFRKVNNITGWTVGLLACITYFIAREATGSFWDCGEFISSAYKLQNPHPPGAPMFTLLGRLFIILFGSFGDDPSSPARAVNMMSALASGFTIMFLFWTITHFARKMFVKVGEALSPQQLFTVMTAGVVGAIAYCFSDSFWFSAVEGEVYALSSFFTALVFWAMLKWEHADEHAGSDAGERNKADRWIIFLFFMMGLSIGVHLLNLLTIPAVVMIFYFRRYTPSVKGGIIAFIVGCIITGIVQVAVIQWTVKLAGTFDRWFVNGFDLPFFSGFVFFFVLLAALVWLGIRFANKNGWAFLRLGLWCFTFMMIGYSTYVTSLIRSNANTAVDMNNVDNPMSLVYWLSREQYGTQPLLYGPHFAAQYKEDENNRGYIAFNEGAMKYVKGKTHYEEIGRDREPLYDNGDMQLFPRVWDSSNDQGHADFYIDWLQLNNTGEDTDPDKITEFPRNSGNKIKKPGLKENVEWFTSYQLGLMYWRYFMWNFSGKQNDIQGLGNKRDGNWISGISFLDNKRLGDQSKLPESIKTNKAHNTLYLLPFILGIVGCVYQYLKNKTDFVVSFLLFFLTGIGIVIYLNQPGNQPRERDYAYVGSFYAYAIWIGLAVVSFVKLAKEKEDKKSLLNLLSYGSILSFFIGLMSSQPSTGIDAVFTGVVLGVLYAVVAAAIIFLVRAVSSAGQNAKTANIVTAAVCMAVPILMASQEWNDHDRGEKELARDTARNYLESCAKDAIIFTFGDNDTYPLWYAQEVEGIRPDIRIINNSLLGIDWYINQLRYKINDAAPVDVIFTPEEIQGSARNYLQFSANAKLNPNAYNDLLVAMKAFKGKEFEQSFPVRRFQITVDPAQVKANGTVSATDSVVTEMRFELPARKNDLMKNDLIMLAVIASNNFKRPIYFTSPYGELGFEQYIRKDGISYRLVPVQNKFPQITNWVVDKAYREARLGGTQLRDNNTEVMYKNMMDPNKFKSGGADNKDGVYFDEENRRHLLTLRATYGELAGNLADEGKVDEAKKVLGRVEGMLYTGNMPYAMVSRYNQHNQTALIYLEGAYKAGDTQLAEKVGKAIRKDLEDQKKYYDYLKTERESLYSSLSLEEYVNNALFGILDKIEQRYGKQATVPTENSGTINNKAAGADTIQPKDTNK